MNGAAFQFITNSGTTTFTALLGGSSVFSFTANTNQDGRTTPQWYGFDSSIAFDQVEFNTSNTLNNAFALDNLEVGSAAVTGTPEPASITMLATGLLGLVGVARARRKNRKH